MHGMVPTSVTIMQYADDTLLFLRNDICHKPKMNYILLCADVRDENQVS
jgi:hypothetical protein